jgi:hypothetical protein
MAQVRVPNYDKIRARNRLPINTHRHFARAKNCARRLANVKFSPPPYLQLGCPLSFKSQRLTPIDRTQQDGRPLRLFSGHRLGYSCPVPTLFGLYNRARKALGLRHFNGIAPFELDPARRDEFAAKASSDLARLFFAHQGRLIHKPVHYLDIYDRHFCHWRGKSVRFLEIGVFKGGSLELWREYFGCKATIYGIDIDPNCAQRADFPNHVCIGSQDDPVFLENVVTEMGPPDIILDDGSHIDRHQTASFHALFPLLADGGLYVIEDVCTSYWPTHGGGYRRKGSAIELAKQIIDDMHAWYHFHQPKTPANTLIPAVHIYNSMIVIEKGRNAPLQQIKVSGNEHI